MGYEFKTKSRKLYTARTTTDGPGGQTIIEFEFEKKGGGWYVKKFIFRPENDNLEVTDMYLPEDIVEKILLVESTKDKLTEGE
jgi:hypothetical protein